MNRADRRRRGLTGVSRTPMRLAGVGALIGSGLVGGYLGGRTGTAYAVPPPTCSPLVPGGIGSDDSLNLAIDQVNLGNCRIIDISHGFTLRSRPTAINVDRVPALTLTATSDDSVLDGDHHAGIAIASTGDTDITLQVSNLTFTNFDDSQGAWNALSVDAYADLTAHLTDVAFLDNYGGNLAGGAHFFARGAALVQFHGHALFRGNRSYLDAGALRVDSARHESRVILGDDTAAPGLITFDANVSTSAHGGALWVDDASIHRAVFTDDTAAQAGGAVFAYGVVDVSHSDFSGNTTGQWGGAIQAYLVDAHHVTFADNAALGSGGAGGAINADGLLGSTVVADSSFTGNAVDGQGGAIRARGPVQSLRSTFQDDSAAYGGAISSDDTVFITSSLFQGEAASASGGAIMSRFAGVVSHGSTFDGNSAGSKGGAILASTDVTSLDDSFLGNATGSFDGGAIKAGGSATTTGSYFGDNHAARDGGAVWARLVDDSGSTFVANTALERGGAVRNPGPGATTLHGSTFTDDSAATGGGVEAHGLILATHAVFRDDTAALSGGAIYAHGGIDIRESTFEGNSAGQNGGGIITRTTSANAISGSSFTGNTAGGSVGGEGGGAVLADDTLTVSDTTFSGNVATHAGGAVYGKNALIVSASSFTANRALTAQGGALAGGGDLTVGDSTFDGNDSAMQGGAIWSWGRTELTDDTLTNNASLTDVGGAIWSHVDTSSTTTLFRGNHASTNGGAVFSDGTATAVDSTFTANWAAGSAGAVHADDTLTLVSSTFTDDTAAMWGGALRASELVATYTSFVHNSAALGGVGFLSRGARVTNSTFADNNASNTGGVFYLDGGTSSTTALYFSTLAGNTAARGTAISGPSTAVLRLSGSVLAGDTGTLCYDSWQVDDTLDALPGSSYSFATDTSCTDGSPSTDDDSISTSFGSLAALGLTTAVTADDTPGLQVLIPDDTSVLRDAVPSTWVPGATRDQLGAVRTPGPPRTTAGAVQVRDIAIVGPENLLVAAGATASFPVTATAGIGTAVGYRWQSSRDGITWTDIVGNPSAATATLVLPQVGSADSGLRVRVQVTDLRNTRASTSATLTVRTPAPASDPPSAPREPKAVAGDRQASIVWKPPATAGSFPVTTYEVRTEADSRTCLLAMAPATDLACTITGLSNGRSYRFSVRALNGAGWGPWSDWTAPVTPLPLAPTIVITGTRAGSRAVVQGTSSGIEGQTVQAMVRVAGQISYGAGSIRPVDDHGDFTWQRKANKKVYVYFTHAQARSNRVIIAPRS